MREIQTNAGCVAKTDIVEKYAKHMLDMMILSPGSGRSYEILYCLYNDIKKYWMIRYEISWYNGNLHEFRHRKLHITDKRVMEFYEC